MDLVEAYEPIVEFVEVGVPGPAGGPGPTGPPGADADLPDALFHADRPTNTLLPTWDNQGSAAWDTLGDSKLLSIAAGGGAGDRARVKTLPATPYSLTVGFSPHLFTDAGSSCGIILLESSSGKRIHCAMTYDALIKLRRENFSDATTLDVAEGIVYFFAQPMLFWLRVINDGTDISCWWSSDGSYFQKFRSDGATAYLSGGADKGGVFINSSTPDQDNGMMVFFWRVEATATPNMDPPFWGRLIGTPLGI